MATRAHAAGRSPAERAHAGPSGDLRALRALASAHEVGKTDQVSEPDPAPLSRAIVTLLEPLVRLVLKRGMAFGQFSELVKRAYVEVAQKDFAVPGRKLTISRIAVLTGLTRKEAKRVAQSEGGDETAASRRRVNRAARVVSAWVAEPDYHDGRGGPASLGFAYSDDPSFSSLVQEHGADVTARAVLDELLRVGAVEHLKDGRIRLVERAYIPQADESAKLEILGTDVADLIGSIEHNLEPEHERSFYQRKVAYDNLPAAWLPALQEMVRTRAQELLEELNEEMAAHDLDVAPEQDAKGGSRAMVGIYYFQEENEEDPNETD